MIKVVNNKVILELYKESLKYLANELPQYDEFTKELWRALEKIEEYEKHVETLPKLKISISQRN